MQTQIPAQAVVPTQTPTPTTRTHEHKHMSTNADTALTMTRRSLPHGRHGNKRPPKPVCHPTEKRWWKFIWIRSVLLCNLC